MLLRIDSLSEIPSRKPPRQKSSEAIADLPVYCLGLQKDPDSSGLLIVTDFTPVEVKGVRLWKKDFDLTEAGVLDESLVFGISCTVEVFKHLSDLVGPDTDKIHKKGLFLQVKFVSIHNRKEWFGSLESVEDVKIITNIELRGSPRIQKLHERFSMYASPEVKANCVKKLQQLTEERERITKRRIEEVSQLNFFKSARVPTGTALAFHQQPDTQLFDDGNSSYSSDNDSISSPQVLRTSHITEEVAIDSTVSNNQPISNDNILSNQTSLEHLEDSPPQKLILHQNFDTFLINRVSLSILKRLSTSADDVSMDTTFEVMGYLRMPLPIDDFIIKPHHRTLKLSNPRLFLLEQVNSVNSQYLELEFHTEEEKCRFLGIEEVEDVLANYAQVKDRIASVVSMTSQTAVKVTRRLTSQHGLSLCYWTCVNTVTDFL